MQTGAKSDGGAAARCIPRIGGKRGDLKQNVVQDELGDKTVTREHQRRSELLVSETRLTHRAANGHAFERVSLYTQEINNHHRTPMLVNGKMATILESR